MGIGVTDPNRFELQDLVELLGAQALADADSVSAFVSATLGALHADDMSFALLLPDDDGTMEARLGALADWCQSFLTGLAAGLHRRGIGTLAELPDEVNEIIRDIAAIAQLDTAVQEPGSEADFMELEEYVKVGTLLIMSLMDDGGDNTEE